jgi:hypothetical protein
VLVGGRGHRSPVWLPAPVRTARLPDGRVCWQHCWNRLLDGAILDATADQFEADWLGDLVVLAPDDPHTAAYQSAPLGWTFMLRGYAPVLELVAIPDGSGRSETTRCRDWLHAAQHVLRAMTGWELPADLIDYVARILWVRTSGAQPITSGQIADLLTMYEWAHRATRRGRPWLAPEYAAIDLAARADSTLIGRTVTSGLQGPATTG